MPANAADWNNSVKDRRSIPVPAPIPVVEDFRWYVRADIGFGLGQEADVSENGLLYGVPLDPSVPPFGMSSAWFNKDFDTFFTGGVGVGAYLTPRLRTDLTVDARTASDIKVDQTGTYTTGGGNVTFHTWEKTEVRNTVTLANLYVDLSQRGSGLTPYIGAGVGFVVRSMDRRHITDEDTNGDTVVDRTFTGSGKAHQVAFAAAAMAGLAWSISPNTVLDLNYRFMWLGPVDMSTTINGLAGPNSRLSVGDSFDHQFRAGLRWNVW
jgi:opacity protein-like surface antigen